MQDHTPGNEDVNEAVEESFPASDPPAYSTPHAEHQQAAAMGNRISPVTWVMMALAAALLIWLVSLAF